MRRCRALLSAAGLWAPVAAAAPLPMQVMQVQPAQGYELRVAHPGEVAGAREAVLGFERGGRIRRLDADLGDALGQGAVLAALDCEQERLASSLGAARLQEARAGEKLAQAQHRRAVKLADQGLLDSSNLDIRAAEFEVAQARAASARASLGRLRDEEARCRLVAPWPGTVARRFLDEGAIVAPGTPVLQWVDAANLEVRARVPLDFAAGLQPGEALQVRAADAVLEARLERLGPASRDSSQRREIRLRLEKAAGLVVGDAVEVLQAVRRAAPGFWVPTSALRAGQEGFWSLMRVYERRGDSGRISPVPVEVLHVEDGRAYVRGPLRSGDEVVATGAGLVAPRQQISIRPYEQAAP